MRYYGFVDSRIEEQFEDIDFYDRMIPIGYSKVYTPLVQKCHEVKGGYNLYFYAVDNLPHIRNRKLEELGI